MKILGKIIAVVFIAVFTFTLVFAGGQHNSDSTSMTAGSATDEISETGDEITPVSGGDGNITVSGSVYDDNIEPKDVNTEAINNLQNQINNLYEEIKTLKESGLGQKKINAGPFKISCTQDNTFNLVLTATNTKDFSSRSFKVIYNTSELEVVDLCAATSALETSACNVAGTNITITKADPGVIEFIIFNPVEYGNTWSGAVNTVIFKSKINGQATVTYTVE